MANKYLVIYEVDGELLEPKISIPHFIWETMDLADCMPINVAKLWLIKGTELIECQFYGTWHNGNEPLRMEIRNGETTLDVGYGTDH